MAIGVWLKTAREKQNLTLRNVEKETGINSKYLEAIESEDFTVLPAEPVYIKGFIRSYAEFLSLNPMQAIDIYNGKIFPPANEVADVIELVMVEAQPGNNAAEKAAEPSLIDKKSGVSDKAKASSATTKKKVAKKPSKPSLSIEETGVGTATMPPLGIWENDSLPTVLQAEPEKVSTKKLVAESKKRSNKKWWFLIIVIIAAAVAVWQNYDQLQALIDPGSRNENKTIQSEKSDLTQPDKQAHQFEPSKEQLKPSGEQVKPSKESAASEENKVKQSAQPVTLTAKATEESWLSVVVDGNEVFADTLAKNESKTWAGKEIEVRIGNAAGVEWTYNGKAQGTLGGDGEIVDKTFGGNR